MQQVVSLWRLPFICLVYTSRGDVSVGHVTTWSDVIVRGARIPITPYIRHFYTGGNGIPRSACKVSFTVMLFSTSTEAAARGQCGRFEAPSPVCRYVLPLPTSARSMKILIIAHALGVLRHLKISRWNVTQRFV